MVSADSAGVTRRLRKRQSDCLLNLSSLQEWKTTNVTDFELSLQTPVHTAVCVGWRSAASAACFPILQLRASSWAPQRLPSSGDQHPIWQRVRMGRSTGSRMRCWPFLPHVCTASLGLMNCSLHCCCPGPSIVRFDKHLAGIRVTREWGLSRDHSARHHTHCGWSPGTTVSHIIRLAVVCSSL